MHDASHPPKRLRADYGTTGGSATGGKSPSVLNRLLQDSRLTVEQGVPALPTLPFITSSVTALPLEEAREDRPESGELAYPANIGPSARFVVLSDSSHHSGANSADPEVDLSLSRVTASVRFLVLQAHLRKTDRTLSLFTGRSGSGFDAGSIRTKEAIGAGSEEIYVPESTVTKGFKLNDGRLCANMIDHFTPPAFFKTVRGMEHEQLFTEFNVSAARNLSLSSEVRMRIATSILLLEKRKGDLLRRRKNILLEAKDKEIEDLKSQLLKAKEESAEVTQLRAPGFWFVETGSTLFEEKLLRQRTTQVEMYEEGLKQLENFKINLYGTSMGTRLAMIDAVSHGVVCAFKRDVCMISESYIPSVEDDFNSAIRDLRDLNFPLLQELSNKKDASTWDIMDLLRLDDAVHERVVIGKSSLSLLWIFGRGRVEKMEWNLIEPSPLFERVFVLPLDDLFPLRL
ncbi:hypothetical protein Tco_0743195 [Tanacetum coccineum]